MKKVLTTQFQLATILLTMLLLFGAVLGWFHHQKTSDIFLSSSKELFEQVANDVTEHFYSAYGPVSTTVRLLSLSPLPKDEDLKDRLSRLPVLVDILQSQPEIVALSVGYSNAEYFIVRSLNSDYMIKRFGAPEGAAYVVDNIEREEGQPDFRRFFYQADLTLISSKDLGFTSYNPTVRPWYRLALYSQDVTTTAPYLFYFIGKVGVTLVKEETATGNVMAADITLESLSNTLRDNRVSPSSQMLIYTSDNEVIASLEPDSIVLSSTNEDLSIAQLEDINSEVVTDFFKLAPAVDDSHFFLDSGGKRWIGINKPITLVGFTAKLLILAPESELLAEASAIRNESTLVILLIILFSIPIAIIAAQQMTRPFKRLVARSEPIRRGDFSQNATVETQIKDIQHLSEALEKSRAATIGLSRLFKALSHETDNHRIVQLLGREVLELSNADAVLMYLFHDHDGILIPSGLQTPQGARAPHTLPRLNIQDENLALVAAFQNDFHSRIIINRSTTTTTGTHDSLLNYLGADQIIAVTLPLTARDRQKSGLLCLLFKAMTQTENDPTANRERIDFFESLAALCSLALYKKLR